MNVVGKISVGLTAAVLAGQAAGAADDAESADHPYAGIAARNVFALLPVPPPPDPNAKPEEAPPKITANGIMSIFGQLQALFKVAVPAVAGTPPGKPGVPGQPPAAGQPAHDQSYMLSEGQRQDDIEVVKIDEKAATITFNNHGVTQEIPLTTQGSSGPAGPGPISTPGSPFAPGGPGGRRPGGFGGSGGIASAAGGSNPMPFHGNNPFNPNNPNNPGNNGNNAANALMGGLNGGGNPQIYQPETGGLTPEEQAVLIETERAAQETSEKPAYNPNLLPTTSLTPKEK